MKRCIERLIIFFLMTVLIIQIAACSNTVVQEAKTEGKIMPEVGDTISLGRFKQEADLLPDVIRSPGDDALMEYSFPGPEDIRWRVLAKEDDKMLIISELCLKSMPFYKSRTDPDDKPVQWKDSKIRSWLNNHFYKHAFNKDEKERILMTECLSDENEVFHTKSGESTVDRVFLLSASEAKKYFSSDEARICKFSNDAVGINLYNHSSDKTACWWLRTSGESDFYKMCVDYQGRVDNYWGDPMYIAWYGVRPAMWIRKEDF